ncbi:ABC transporter permease [Streptomyces sp. SS8]
MSLRPRTRGVTANTRSASWRVAVRITALSVRAQLEYRMDFLLGLLVGIFWQTSVLAFASVLLLRFPGMGGWPVGDVLLIVAMRLLSHGLYVMIFTNVNDLGLIVQQGRFDGFLLRPMPVYRQVLLHRFNVNAFGDLCVAGTLFAAALSQLAVDWTAAKAAYLAAAVLGGTLMEAAVQTALACAALRAATARTWSQWLDELTTTFGNYPLHILPTVVQAVFTYVLPIAFIAYLPAAVLTGHGLAPWIPRPLAVVSPLIGLVAFVAARRLWSASLRLYQGVGGF